MDAEENYYEILGVNPNASEEEIKNAYRDKALIFHPDRLRNLREEARRWAEERMKRVNKAYETLRDPQKRKQYDADYLQEENESATTHKQEHTQSKPIIVIEPPQIFFRDVIVGELKSSSFTIRNIGGPYKRLFFNNPNSWVKITRWFSLNDDSELPIKVEIEAIGEEWDKTYTEFIVFKFDEEVAVVKVELKTELKENKHTTDYSSKSDRNRPKKRQFIREKERPLVTSVISKKKKIVKKGIFGLMLTIFLFLGIINWAKPKEATDEKIPIDANNTVIVTKERIPAPIFLIPRGTENNPIILSNGSKVYEASNQIWVEKHKGKRLIAEHTGFNCPGLAISPDEKLIAFFVGTMKGSTLRIFSIEGKFVKEYLWLFWGLPEGISWSPDGKFIAFSVQYNDGITDNDGIYTYGIKEDIPLSEKMLKKLTRIGNYPSWSPNSQEIIFTANNNYYGVHVDTLTVRKFEDHP